MSLSERLNNPISTAELERRWAAVRTAMERDRIDVLMMQNNNDHMGGYVRYFTDMPATNGYPNTVLFPRDDEMTVVCQGPFGGSEPTAMGDQKKGDLPGSVRRQRADGDGRPEERRADLAGRETADDDAELRVRALHQGL
jgi:hypothetical protein